MKLLQRIEGKFALKKNRKENGSRSNNVPRGGY